jgi:hypothetical protein
LFTIRAFYLDIAQWAADDPARTQLSEPTLLLAAEASHAAARTD